MSYAYDVSDCLAMSEDWDWYAFPRGMKRSALMSILVEGCDGDWWDAVHTWKIRAGWVRPVSAPDGSSQPWHEECTEDHPDAIPVWTCRA